MYIILNAIIIKVILINFLIVIRLKYDLKEKKFKLQMSYVYIFTINYSLLCSFIISFIIYILKFRDFMI